MYKIAIVEDNLKDANLLEDLLNRYLKSNPGYSISFSWEKEPIKFVSEFRKSKFDIIFLDVEMPGMNGIEVAKKVRESDSDVVIIFITNIARYAVNGYEVNALDYLLKPVSFFNFSLKMDEALRHLFNRPAPFVSISVPGFGFIKAKVEEILYVEGNDHYVLFHFSQKVLRVHTSLEKASQLLLKSSFCRSSNSFLINLRYVDNVCSDVVAVGKERLPLSRSRRRDFLDSLAVYYGEK